MKKFATLFYSMLICAASLPAVIASPLVVGKAPPDFALRSLDGPNLRLSEYRSEVVVLNFWAARCSRCRDALPVLDSMYQSNKRDGLNVLSVNIDGNAEKVSRFIADAEISFPVMADSEQKTVSRMYELGDLPLTLVIDREGNLRYVHKGFKKDSGAQIAAEVARLLAE